MKKAGAEGRDFELRTFTRLTQSKTVIYEQCTKTINQMYKKKEIGNHDSDFTIYMIQTKNHGTTGIPKKPEYQVNITN
jgi:hypothetical protein